MGQDPRRGRLRQTGVPAAVGLAYDRSMAEPAVYYESKGSGEPLVLLHAAVADSRQWDDQVAAFAERYRVIRYDMQSFGRTPPAAQPVRRADELYELMRALDVPRAHLVGVSNGGSAALDFTVLYPDMVGALIPVATGLSGFEPIDRSVVEAMLEQDELEQAAVARGDFDAATEISMGTWLAGEGRRVEDIDPALRVRVAEMTRHAIESSSKRHPTPRLEPGAAPRLGEIRAPTLVVVGDHEVPFVKATVNYVVQSIPGARKYEFANAAHWLNMEHPAEFTRVVLEFLAAHPFD
jgi:3-oxoadipate enol-lactonase